jgi:hypothetical protein
LVWKWVGWKGCGLGGEEGGEGDLED